MPKDNFRETYGPREDIAVVGPRNAGVSTLLCMLLAEYHAMKGKSVYLVAPHSIREGKATVQHPTIKCSYQIGRKAPDWRGLPPYDVVIHDGYIPPHTMCRVIMASEIF